MLPELEAALDADPDDPRAWAAYLDALDDAGDPRGQFLRLRDALDVARLDRSTVEREVRRVWQDEADRWQTPALRAVGRVGFYHMGDGADPLLRVKALPPAAADAVRSSPLRWLIRGVKVEPAVNLWAGPGFLDFLAALGRTRVRTLAVTNHRFADVGLAALVDCDLFPRLSDLHLPGCDLTDHGAELLADHPHTPRLRVLDLDDNLLSHAGFGALAAVGVVVSDRQRFLPGGWDFDDRAFPRG